MYTVASSLTASTKPLHFRIRLPGYLEANDREPEYDITF